MQTFATLLSKLHHCNQHISKGDLSPFVERVTLFTLSNAELQCFHIINFLFSFPELETKKKKKTQSVSTFLIVMKYQSNLVTFRH